MAGFLRNFPEDEEDREAVRRQNAQFQEYHNANRQNNAQFEENGLNRELLRRFRVNRVHEDELLGNDEQEMEVEPEVQDERQVESEESDADDHVIVESSTESSSSDDEESINEEEWAAESLKCHDFPFMVEPGLETGLATTPYDYFKLVFNDMFINHLTAFINANAIHILAQKSVKKAAEFKPATNEETYILLGVYFLMGYIKVSNMSHYWSSHPLFNLRFDDYISRDRFCILLRAMAYKKPPRTDDNGDSRRSWYDNAKPIANMFNCVMKSLAIPGKELNLDRFTAHWFNEMNFVKRRPERIRMHLLSDTNGIFHRIYLCHPDGQIKSDEIVKNLMSDFFESGRSLYSCPFYTSISLAEELLAKKTYLTGILKPGKHRNPAYTRKKIRVGTVKALYNSEGVCVFNIRKPQKTVVGLTTEHNPKKISIATADIEPITKFKAHTNMFRRNQTLADNAPSDTTRRYNRHVLYILQAMFMNSFIMFNMKQSAGDMVTYSDYRRSIFYDLLPAPNVVPETDSDDDDELSGNEDENQDEVIHLAADWPPGKKVKFCRHCHMNGIKKRTQYYCPQCPQKWGLCIECFRAFHKY